MFVHKETKQRRFFMLGCEPDGWEQASLLPRPEPIGTCYYVCVEPYGAATEAGIRKRKHNAVPKGSVMRVNVYTNRCKFFAPGQQISEDWMTPREAMDQGIVLRRRRFINNSTQDTNVQPISTTTPDLDVIAMPSTPQSFDGVASTTLPTPMAVVPAPMAVVSAPTAFVPFKKSTTPIQASRLQPEEIINRMLFALNMHGPAAAYPLILHELMCYQM